MRYTYRVYYYYDKSYETSSMLIRANTKADAERKFKRKFPERKIIFIK